MKAKKICIIEDLQINYDRYKQMLMEVIESDELNQTCILMELPCAGSINYNEFESQLMNEQPEIIFLDYDLQWNNGRYDAPNVIQSVIRYYSKLNYPPVIVLNTQREDKIRHIGSLLNFSNQRNEFPKEFLMSLTAEELQNEKGSLVSLLNYSLEITDQNSTYYEWVPGITAYAYPSIQDFEPSLFSKASFSETNWLNPANRIPELNLNKKNLLLIAATTTYGGKGKLGIILFLDVGDEIRKAIFTFEKKSQIEDYLNSDQTSTTFRKLGGLWYNSRYFKKKFLVDRVVFGEPYLQLKRKYSFDKERELATCECLEEDHPIYSLLMPIKL